jgi:hypothetical protein
MAIRIWFCGNNDDAACVIFGHELLAYKRKELKTDKTM